MNTDTEISASERTDQFAPIDPTTTEPGERGSLDVASSVLKKVVEHAADNAPSTRRRMRRVAGLEMGEVGSSARISQRPDLVDVRLELSLVYPGAIRDAVADVRRRVADELQQITGQQLGRFSVEIDSLESDRAPAADTARVR